MFWTIVVALLLLNMCFDLAYAFRFILIIFYHVFRRTFRSPSGLMEDNIFKVICLTTDLDFNCHMNNARYLRECDFGRIKWFLETDVWKTIRSLGGNALTSASTIRYRRSVELFDIIHIHTKVLCWDDRAFYMEHRFERQSDKFICAIAVVKLSVIRISPQMVVDKLLAEGTESPPVPELVQRWIEHNQASSDKLKSL